MTTRWIRRSTRTAKAWAELNDEATEKAKREAEFNAKQLKLPGT